MFPVMFIENSSIPKDQENLFDTNYRTELSYNRASFSSKGTGNLGIMKPDIMCPGTSIFSAKSLKESNANHSKITVKSGTSMSASICAGGAALVYQYFNEGKYRNETINPSAALARSFMINSADPISNVRPNAVNGYGVLNLGKCMYNDNCSILVGDRLKIDEDHLIAKVSLTKNRFSDFRVTISYLDAALSPDSSAALAVDLDLVIVSPSGTVYRGNQREDQTEEHYSTNERIIIGKEDVEDGLYEIHVFRSIPKDLEESLSDSIEFAITIFGPISTEENNFVEFSKAEKCIPVKNGSCDNSTALNNCHKMFYGRSCQIAAIEYKPNDSSRKILKLSPYGFSVVVLDFPEFEFGTVSYRVTPVSIFEPKIAAFFNTTVAGIESEADLISTTNGFVANYKYEKEISTNLPFATLTIYNTSPYPVDFVISSEYTKPETPPPTSTQTPNPSFSPTSDSSFSPTSEISFTPTPNPSFSPTPKPTSVPTNIPTPDPTSSLQPSSDSDSQMVPKKKYFVALSFAVIFALILFVIIIVFIVYKIMKNKKDYSSSSLITGLNKNLL